MKAEQFIPQQARYDLESHHGWPQVIGSSTFASAGVPVSSHIFFSSTSSVWSQSGVPQYAHAGDLFWTLPA